MHLRIGYIRVSTQEQNTVRQEVLMESLGVDEVYIDRMSGKNAGRPELRRMLEYVRRGDSPMKGRMPDDRAIAAGALDAFLTWFIQRYQQE